jgi:hypothetical protein
MPWNPLTKALTLRLWNTVHKVPGS